MAGPTDPPVEAPFRPTLDSMNVIESLTLSSGTEPAKAQRFQFFMTLLLLEINEQLIDIRLLLTNPRGRREAAGGP